MIVFIVPYKVTKSAVSRTSYPNITQEKNTRHFSFQIKIPIRSTLQPAQTCIHGSIIPLEHTLLLQIPQSLFVQSSRGLFRNQFVEAVGIAAVSFGVLDDAEIGSSDEVARILRGYSFVDFGVGIQV